jgi:serine/threonine protein kinase
MLHDPSPVDRFGRVVRRVDRLEPILLRFTAVTQSDEPESGTVLAGKYELETVLGKGGMGVVFRGRHLGTERPIAVKILRRELMSDATLAKRFMREAKAAAALQHPNVVDVLDYGVDTDGTAFQVLELLDGESLGEHLQRKGTVPIDVTLSLLLPVIHALVMAHARGVIHRDLKPDNVFLARNAHGRVVPKLLDFGIAKLMRKDGAKSTVATRAGSAIGTPAYMSPEQARGTDDVGTSTDVWAIGVILFECIAGRIPFEAETGSILMARIITEQAPSLRSVAPETPEAIVRVIDRALAAAQIDRWPSMSALGDALREAAAESGIAIAPPGASDTAPMSLPPPRARAHWDIDAEEPISSGGGGDADADVEAHPVTRTGSRKGARHPTPATHPKLGAHAQPLRETDPAPSLPMRGGAVPMLRVVAVSVVLAVMAFLGLWMREPPAAAVTVEPPPVGTSARPRIEAPASAPLVIDPPARAIVDAVPVAEVPSAPPVPAVAEPRERRGHATVHETPAPETPTTTTSTHEAPRSTEPGSHLPELTEW